MRVPGVLTLLLLCALAWGAWERHGRLAALSASDARERVLRAAVAAQETLRTKEHHEAEDRAHAAEDRHAAVLAAARDDTARYVALHRVQPNRACSPAVAISEADPAGIREDVPGAFVLVAEADVRRAAEWQAYAVALHDWAVMVSDPAGQREGATSEPDIQRR